MDKQRYFQLALEHSGHRFRVKLCIIRGGWVFVAESGDILHSVIIILSKSPCFDFITRV